MTAPLREISESAPRAAGAPVGADNTSMVSLGRPRGLKRIVLVLLAIALVVAVLGELSKQSRGARGPESSSYATSPGGLAALLSLLRAQNIPTKQITTSIDKALASGNVQTFDVIVVIDQDLTRAEMEALANHLVSGGRLVAGGRDSGAWLSRVYDRYIERTDGFRPDVRTTLRLAPGALGEISANSTVDEPWSVVAAGRPLAWSGVPDRQQTFALDADLNPVAFRLAGLTALSETSVLTNQVLAESDNAAFALDLLGPGADGQLGQPTRVVFAEAGHGFRSGAGSGLAAIPANIRVLLLGLLLSALTWMLAVGRRVGVPDLADRPLAPGRFEHVAAVASLLARAQRRDRSNASPSQPSKDV